MSAAAAVRALKISTSDSAHNQTKHDNTSKSKIHKDRLSSINDKIVQSTYEINSCNIFQYFPILLFIMMQIYV